ncbi:MAG: aconitate hydratase [Promethearchaeota archaeon]
MRGTLVEKVLAAHLVEGRLVPGEEVGVRVDQTLTQDATGTVAYLQFENMGVDRVQTELSVSYVDHNTLQTQFHNADDHRYLQTVAAKYGVLYSKAGNGICHQVHLERFGAPGKTLLGSDSHTPTSGGLGMFAVGAGGLDVAAAMAGAPFYLTCPRVAKVHLSGKLGPWVSAKDVVLELLRRLTSKGNVGWVLEYGGPGLEGLSVPERATIANMGAETGVTTSIFPSDGRTREFLRAQDREGDWVELVAEDDAEYDKVIEVNLSDLVPLAAKPHNPDNVVPVTELGEIPVQQVLFGSCTNGSLVDLTRVAKILEGRKVHPDVSVGLAPGSRQVLSVLADTGHLASLIDSGVRILESACGFCIGNGQAPETNATSLRTNNRNFLGRSGTRSANVYLVSPETAAAAAITGKFVDPRSLTELGMDYPSFEMPKRFHVDDSMILLPPALGTDVKVVKGPNIVDVPRNSPLPEEFTAVVTLKVGDKVTTDHIMPAGQRLIYRSNVPKYAEFVFEPVDPTFATRALSTRDDERRVYNCVVAGESYGQGSSREHAALCPMYLGVKVVLAKSMERIHAANLVNFGVVPLQFADHGDYDRLEQGFKLEFSGLGDQLRSGGTVRATARPAEGEAFEMLLKHSLSSRQVELVVAGGFANAWASKRGGKRGGT